MGFNSAFKGLTLQSMNFEEHIFKMEFLPHSKHPQPHYKTHLVNTVRKNNHCFFSKTFKMVCGQSAGFLMFHLCCCCCLLSLSSWSCLFLLYQSLCTHSDIEDCFLYARHHSHLFNTHTFYSKGLVLKSESIDHLFLSSLWFSYILSGSASVILKVTVKLLSSASFPFHSLMPLFHTA